MIVLRLTMDTDLGILCFQHCSSKVFCFQVPAQCPLCGNDLATEDFQLPAFRVPFPFVRATQHPCSIVIKPTSGDFLNDYLNSMDLHIGVTTSSGGIVEFDKDGLQQHQRPAHWQQCLVVPGVTGPCTEHWDSTLHYTASRSCWVASRYNEHSFNCYTFVLEFLCSLEYGELSKAAVSRTAFCERFIVPRTTAAGKYISLFRKLKHCGCYIQNGGNDIKAG